MDHLTAVPQWYTGLVRSWIAGGYFDGDVLLGPSILVYFVIGALLTHILCMSHFGAMLFGGAVADAPAKPQASSGGKNATRTGLRRAAKESGRKRRQCPDDLELKMVLVVRKDLKLKAPEVASHCAQAAIEGVAQSTSAPLPSGPSTEPTTPEEEALERRSMWRQWLEWWNEEGVAKVVLKAESDEVLSAVTGECAAMGLPFVKVADAVVAVGPAPVEDIDEVCGDLKLF
jgi:peptidyl-tRNA hydrolase